ncbi:unnamed protein product, partial [Staurois parvus]
GYRWVALLGTGGWVGTGGWHCWAQEGGTSGDRWVHCWAQVGDLLGTGGSSAGHRWAELVGALLSTGGRNLWVALLGTMIGADPRSDNCRFTAVLSSRSDSVRKVQPRTGNC